MKPAKLLFFLVLGIFMSGCNSRNSLNLSETNCEGEVPVVGNLRFQFDKNIAPDSLLDKWVDGAYLEFKPAIKGKFQWKHANELIFSPEKSLAPSTEYYAVFKQDLVKNSAFNLRNMKELRFHTPWLNLNEVNGMWTRAESLSSEIFPEINLMFNYSVRPEQVAENMHLISGNEKLDFRMVSTEPGQQLQVRILNIRPEDKDLNLKILLKKGLKPAEGNTGTPQSIEAEVMLPSPYNLVIGGVEAEHDGITGRINLFTSQKISGEIPLKDFITLEPQVRFEASLKEDGIEIRSDGFDLSRNYTIVVKKGLKGIIGGTLKEQYSNDIAFGQLEPYIGFMDSKGVYLASRGQKNIEVKINNVKEVKITVSKIYENNLLNARRNGYYPGDSEYEADYYESGESSGYYGDDYDYTSGDIVYEKEIQTRNLPKKGSSRILHFDFPDALKNFKGIYHVQISSQEAYYLRDAKFVSLSDIGIIARQSKSKVYVFLNSISSAESQKGVNLTLYGNNNQIIGQAVSDAGGFAEIPLMHKNIRGFKPSMVVAKTDNDFNYLPFNNTMVETSRFDIGGVRSNPSGLRAFVYGDRGIYRPGEKVYFSAIVRNEFWRSPGTIPIKFRILLPNGKDLKWIKKSLDDQGSAESALELSSSAVSGHYTIEVYSSNDVLLASKTLMVEEFMPDRIKVKAELDKKSCKPGDSLHLLVQASNFFGPPAANRHYECEMQVKEKAFQPERYRGYNFSLSNQDSYFDQVFMEGTTNAAGSAGETFGIPSHFKNKGLLQASVFTTVFDETGRPVSRASYADIVTQEVFFGIHNNGYYYHALNQPVRFNLVALNKDMQVLGTAVAHVLILKKEYKTILSRSGEYFRYESQTQIKTLEDKQIRLSGDRSYYQFVPRTPGDYEIRIALPGANTYVSSTFYSYGMWGEYGNGFEVNREGNIDIETDRASYEAGASAKILFKTPFNGKMLVTLESNELLEHHYVEVKNRSASLNISLKEEAIPNIYITATLLKPHTVTDMPLTVAHGYKPILVEKTSRKIPVKIMAAESSRSNTRQKITVKSLPGCKVTLAAVDEGILQLTNYQTPDPYTFFYTKKALEIMAFDLYPLLLPEIKNSISFTGGDGYDLTKRVNPLPNKRVKLVSNWSGIADAHSGEVSFNIDIPQFSGEIRLMAVAYRNESFGSAEEKIRVADPVVISTALPRFLSPGDSATLPVTITNTTGAGGSGKVNILTTGPIRVISSKSETIGLKANSETRVVFKIVADQSYGPCKLKVEVNMKGEKFAEENDITIRPASSLQKQYSTGYVNGGSTKKLNVSGSGFIASGVQKRLVVSKSPIVEFGNRLSELIQYPHGCTEQVVSAAFPQIYFGDLADLMTPKSEQKTFANYNVLEAIRKIKTRQLYNGSVTLWDDEGTEHWWTTAYAAHFLLEARKAGFDVDGDLINKMLSYLASRSKTRETRIFYFNNNRSKNILPKELPYSLFVLSLAGKPEVATMNYCKQNTQWLALDGKYLLSAAYALSGDRSRFNELLPGSFSGEIAVKENGGSFASDLRDASLALYAVLEADAGNRQVSALASFVSSQLKSRIYLSTQEMTFGLLALGKMARVSGNQAVSARIMMSGKEIGTFSGNTVVLESANLKGNEIDIVASGSGKLYYTLMTSGIPTGKVKEEDQFIRVRKQFFDRYGRPVSGMRFKQNDLIVVGITIDKAYSGNIENVVLTDLLPAGFEIENPRIREIPGMDWIKNESVPTHRDIRDDRINLFVDLVQNRQTYYYAVRAVTAGTYIMGPVMADAMYQGEIHSYHGAGKVRIMAK